MLDSIYSQYMLTCYPKLLLFHTHLHTISIVDMSFVVVNLALPKKMGRTVSFFERSSEIIKKFKQSQSFDWTAALFKKVRMMPDTSMDKNTTTVQEFLRATHQSQPTVGVPTETVLEVLLKRLTVSYTL